MKQSYLFSYFILFLTFFIYERAFAGTHKIVLLEEATNSSCNPCAFYNPGLQNLYAHHFGGMVSVRYRAWWPGQNDPMYQANKKDNYDRISYYNINGVPTYVLDGVYSDVPYDPSEIERQMYERLKLPAPVKISIRDEVTDDSVFVTVTMHVLLDLPQDSLFLRTAVIERMIAYAYPPGTNGETNFADVMRKLLPDALGSGLPSLAVGDSLSFSFRIALQSQWNPDDLAVAAWLQNDATKEILQANIDFPTFVLEEKESHLTLLQPDAINEKAYFIANDNDKALNVHLEFQNQQIPEGWQIRFAVEGKTYQQFDKEIPPGDTLFFTVEFQTSERGSAKADIFAVNLSDPGFYGEGYGYGFRRSLTAVIAAHNSVLLVDDDGGAHYETGFQDILNNLNITSVTISQQDLAYFQSAVNINNYQTVIWNCSDARPAFLPQDIETLKTYLKNGGALILFGQDIGADIFGEGGGSSFDSAKVFYKNTLGAAYIEDNSASGNVVGIEGDTLSDGISFKLLTPYGFSENSPDVVQPDSAARAQPFFYYGNGKIAALRNGGGQYKTLYFAFGLEQIDGQSRREKILKRCLAWTANLTALPNEEMVSCNTFRLLGNYPNPFNPGTTIRYRLATSGRVRLTVYNILGQNVAALVNQKQNSGSYSVRFNAAGLSSGTYFYKLTAKGRTLTGKMLLLR